MALKELIETIAKALVDDPEAVEVTEIEGEHNLLIDQARLDYWRSVGATPSHTVDRLLKKLPTAAAAAAKA